MKTMKGNKFTIFMKRNMYYFLLGFCVLVMATTITVALLTKKPANDLTTNPPIVNPPKDDGNIDDDEANTKPIVFIMPVKDASIGMGFTADGVIYSSTLEEFTGHMGIDFKGAENQDVLAVFDGVVESITYDLLEGTKIVIKHTDDLKTSYGSLAEEVSVAVGDRVKTGDAIGKVSASAYDEFKEGNHVHFEVLEKGARVNPEKYIMIEEK